MKIVVAGGTGFIGRTLVTKLAEEGHDLVVLTRRIIAEHAASTGPVRLVYWDGRNAGNWQREINGAHAVVNLAGEPIAAKRWTPQQKSHIASSRIESTRIIVDAIEKAHQKPSVLINASGVGYYGDVHSGRVTEESPSGDDFFSEICRLWEAEALAAQDLGVRVVALRSGIILHRDGGVLKRFVLPFRMFVGGPLGSGAQWLPWIHREDAIGAISFALRTDTLSGPINLVAPEPVTMQEFCSTLGSVMRRPSWFRVPEFALKLALGEMVDVVIRGQPAVPEKLLNAQYVFKFAKLSEALSDLLGENEVSR